MDDCDLSDADLVPEDPLLFFSALEETRYELVINDFINGLILNDPSDPYEPITFQPFYKKALPPPPRAAAAASAPRPRAPPSKKRVAKPRVHSAPGQKPRKIIRTSAAPPAVAASASRAERPRELQLAPRVPTGTARAWWLALDVQVAETKKHRNPNIVCVRTPVAEADVLADVQASWETLKALPKIEIVQGTSLRAALDRVDERILEFVFERAGWDRDASGNGEQCGARFAVPPPKKGSESRLPVCTKKATSQRGLCTRCSQLANRLDTTVAFILVSAYALTPTDAAALPCLRSIAAFVHWFGCTATYLNRNFCYAEIQSWTASMINALVDARPVLAAEVAGAIAASGPTATVTRAPMWLN